MKAEIQGAIDMEQPKLLIVEDEEGIRQQLKWSFATEYQVFLACRCGWKWAC